MVENPMLELALYNAVKEFILKEGGAEMWAATVQPILRQLAAAGLQSGQAAMIRMGLMTAGGALLTDAELIAAEAAGMTALPAILKRLGMTTARAVRPSPPVVMAAVVGVSIISTTSSVSAATKQMNPENKQGYKTYINKYMDYLARTASIGGNIDRFPPPMLYNQWLNRDTSGAWWQQ